MEKEVTRVSVHAGKERFMQEYSQSVGSEGVPSPQGQDFNAYWTVRDCAQIKGWWLPEGTEEQAPWWLWTGIQQLSQTATASGPLCLSTTAENTPTHRACRECGCAKGPPGGEGLMFFKEQIFAGT